MKKISTYIAILALGALVLSGCSNVFFEKPRQYSGGETASPDIPEEFGTVQVSLSRGTARTIMPEADLAGLYLEYWFTKDGGLSEQKTPAGSIFTLKPGSYTLEVKAFADSGHTGLAARGEADTAFTITAGTAAAPVNITLSPVVTGEGTGELEFILEYPSGVTVETFTLTRIAGEETSIDLAAAGTSSGTVKFSGTDTAVPVGYYLLRVVLKNSGGASSGRAEVVHIYQNLKSEAHYVFTADDFRAYRVTTNADSGPGSLRQALTSALAVTEGPQIIQVLLEPGSVITLESELSHINKNLTIEGNGVTLTRAASWIPGDSSQLLYINTSAAITVTIRRVHFKNGLTTKYGGAILNNKILILESCIFSGNQTTSSDANGGAIHNNSGTLIIRGCTFYNNSAGYVGGAIMNTGTLTLTGNVFYGNSAAYYDYGRAVYNSGGTVTSGGYNVSDGASGTDPGSSGWTFADTDRQAVAIPIGSVSLKPRPGLAAAGWITTRPEGYPTVDFYGDPIPASGAHTGAVQELSGYYIESLGPINIISGTTDADGLYASGTIVTLQAVPVGQKTFEYWKVNGVVQPTQTPADKITVTITANMVVEAVCGAIRVTSGADSGPGTLRQALADALNGDTIILDLTGGKTITLTSELSFSKALILTIEGSGATLTQTGTNRLLDINNSGADVTIRRLRFKDGSYTSASADGGAIYNDGKLTLESCIFSGNQAVSTSTSTYAYGGAIYNNSTGTLIVRGCTFYNNAAVYAGDSLNASGGAIYSSGTLNLTGNVFYGNSAVFFNVVNSGAVSSGGYNVSDKPSGTNSMFDYSGWTFTATDVQATALPIGPVSFKPRPDLAAAGKITTRPGDYPAVDFYGATIPASGAQAGAVQELSGYSLDSQVIGLGSISVILGTADVDGFYTSGTSVTLQAVPVGQRVVGYWKVNGVVQAPQIPANRITLTMDSDKTVEAWIVGLFNTPVTKVEFGGNSTTTVSFSDLANRSVFLVKVNTGDTNVAGANSGSVAGAAGLPLTNMAPSFASSSNAASSGFEPLFMGHPGAMEFNANPPPITAEMRRESRNIARSGRAATLPPPPAVGDTRIFWVETIYGNRVWTQKQATLRATGTYGNVWVMDDAYSETDGGTFDRKITTAQAEAMAQKFDLIYPVETKLLGYEYGGGVPDTDPTYGGKDGDLKVQILVYDFMGGTGGSSGAAGFFWGKDFYTDGELESKGYKTNLAEIFYMEVLQVDLSLDYSYSTLVHEFQHMINFNQKAVLNSKSSPTWYDEMLAKMAEDVISPLIGVGPDNSYHSISQFTGIFLDTYNTESITEWGTLERTSYAKGFAFGAYLMRNWGGAELLGKILANDSVGIPSVTAALDEIEPGMTFEKAVQRYGEALIFSGASKSAGVLSFDNTVDYTLSGTTYTASAFDIWTMGGPKLFPLTDTSELKAYGLIVQSADAWINKTGDLTITLNKPSSPNVELYVMVR